MCATSLYQSDLYTKPCVNVILCLASRAKTITSLPLRREGIESTELNMVKWLLSKVDLDGRCKCSRTNYFKGKKRPDCRGCMFLFSSSWCMHQRSDFLQSKCLVTKYNLNRCHTSSSLAKFSIPLYLSSPDFLSTARPSSRTWRKTNTGLARTKGMQRQRAVYRLSIDWWIDLYWW